MATYKRVNGDYNIITINPGDAVNVTSTNFNVIGDLTVTGNASLTGNIAGDRIYNGTTSIEIQTINGNANITIGGTSNILVAAPTGVYVNGVNSASGNVTGSNVNTAGLVTATGNVTGGNIITGGNIYITRDAEASANPTLRFTDSNVTIVDGTVLGAVEWYTADASPGARVTSAIRSVASGATGNANIQILTSTGGAAATTKVTILNTGNVGIANAAPNDPLAVTGTAYVSGNITGGNINTAGLMSATGNLVTGANLVASGYATVTGNITGGNIITAGLITVTGSVRSSTSLVGNVNVTGGNLISNGTISSTGNVTATDYFGTSVSVTGNVTGGNANITSAVNAATANISSSLTGTGVGVPLFVVLGADAPVASATPANIGGLTFNATANYRYAFEAYIDLVPDGSMTVAPAVNFSAGTCYYTTETQTTATSAWSAATKTTSDDVATTYAMTGTTSRTLRISGTFYHTAGPIAVTLRLQNSTGTITAKAGSYLRYTRVS